MLNLKVIKKNNKRAFCFCPFHKDINKPNLCITLTKDYYGYYHCFACGVGGRLSTAQMKELQLDKDVSEVECVEEINWEKLLFEYTDNLKNKFPLFIQPLLKKWNVDIYTLERMYIGFDGEAYTIPMWNGGNYIIGIQRQFFNGYKCSVEGSKLGVFWPLFSFSFDISDNILLVCEGASDTAVVNSLGFQVIGKPTWNYGDSIIKHIVKYTTLSSKIIIIPDNDIPGAQGAIQLKCELSSFNPVIDTIIPAIKIFKIKKAKDIREYISLKGKSYVKRELEEFINE